MSQTGLLLSGALRRGVAVANYQSAHLLAVDCTRQFSSSVSCNAEKSSAFQAGTAPPRLVVLGGRGFVGSAVCREAVANGLSVVGISRGGTPPLVREPWVSEVQWARGNPLEPKTMERHLQGAEAVVSCIGGFGSNEEMLKTNGAANVAAIEAAKAAGVKRFVYISAHIPNIPGIENVLSGYIRGKRAAEDALRAHFPTTGVALRPGMIYGDRIISTSLTVPLGSVFGPVEALLQRLGPDTAKQMAGVPLLGAAFVPPVSVQTVARAAVRSATDPSVSGGVIDVWELASPAYRRSG